MDAGPGDLSSWHLGGTWSHLSFLVGVGLALPSSVLRLHPGFSTSRLPEGKALFPAPRLMVWEAERTLRHSRIEVTRGILSRKQETDKLRNDQVHLS